ncbi:MAG: ketoacyl-ACP synthase III [Nitrospinota bacterium]|nr:ketoacyl-ACP synthase III [Nitrospinota bacterium]
MKPYIAGTGRFLPERVMTNHDLAKIVDTSDEWIVERTGIKERRIAEKEVCASDLAAPAARDAIKAAGLKAKDIELIIVGTSTPDMLFPSTACFVQAKINATNAVAFDLLAACSGFTFSLATAVQYLKSGLFKNALVIGSEIYSSILDWEDRTTCVLFGDGAGAVVLKADGKGGKSGILSTHIYSDGSKSDFLSAVGGGSARRFTPDLISEKKYCLTMNGQGTFKVAVKSMISAAQATLQEAGLSVSDIDLVIPHQANTRIIAQVAKQLGIEESKCFVNIQKYGNTAAASIPIALDEAIEEGRVKKGDLVLFVTFGGGFTWGSILLRL